MTISINETRSTLEGMAASRARKFSGLSCWIQPGMPRAVTRLLLQDTPREVNRIDATEQSSIERTHRYIRLCRTNPGEAFPVHAVEPQPLTHYVGAHANDHARCILAHRVVARYLPGL